MTELPPAARKQPKQLRSRRMVARILAAAARVFVEVGVQAATTNRIAEDAGVSVGSLYQFFPNKAALLQALKHEWAERVQLAVGEALRPEPWRPLEDIVDRAIGAFEDLDRAQPGLLQVLTEQSGGPHGHADVALAIVRQVESLLAARAPRLAPERRVVVAGLCVHLSDALFTRPAGEGGCFDPLVRAEVKAALVAYLRPLLDAGPS